MPTEIRMRVRGLGQYDKKPFTTWHDQLNGMDDALEFRERLLKQEAPKITEVVIQTREVEEWVDHTPPAPKTLQDKLATYFEDTHPDEYSVETILGIIARDINDLPREVIQPQRDVFDKADVAFYSAGALDARDVIVDRLIGLGEGS